MNIHVVGMGYTGQTISAVLADVGFTVFGSDVNPKVIEMLRHGESHVFEPGLGALIKKHINRTFFVGTPEETPNKEIDAHIVCVHTPIDAQTKKSNLEAMRSAFTEIAQNISRGKLVISRSTVPVGTTRNVVKPILEKSGLVAGKDFYLVCAPERTSQGAALRELRILPQIIGGVDDQSVNEALKIFRKITPSILCVTSLEAAELIKLIDNSYRDLTFAYAQEIADYCTKIGLNAFEVTRAANQNYPRNNVPIPSPGVGGVCLNKDPYILLNSAEEVGQQLRLVTAARQVNEARPGQVAAELSEFGLNGKKVLVAGLAFKGNPETNDTRGSPSIELIGALSKSGARIFGYDPVLEDWKVKELGITRAGTLREGVKDADVVVFMTNHKSFYDLDVRDLFSTAKKNAVVYDGWGIFKKDDITELGLTYVGVGIG